MKIAVKFTEDTTRIDASFREGERFKADFGQLMEIKDGYTQEEVDSKVTEAEQRGFANGKQTENDRFWDMILSNRSAGDYYGAFRYWTCEYLRPPVKIVPSSSSNAAHSLFQWMQNLKIVEATYFDLSNVTSTSGRTMFNRCDSLETIEDINFSNTMAYQYTFYNCGELKTIAKINCSASTAFASAFVGCPKLENITFSGVISVNGVNLQDSPLLTHESLMSLINCLATKTSGTWTVTIGATNKAKLTEAELKIASDKGWTVN